jgi:hypothetical protein
MHYISEAEGDVVPGQGRTGIKKARRVFLLKDDGLSRA